MLVAMGDEGKRGCKRKRAAEPVSSDSEDSSDVEFLMAVLRTESTVTIRPATAAEIVRRGLNPPAAAAAAPANEIELIDLVTPDTTITLTDDSDSASDSSGPNDSDASIDSADEGDDAESGSEGRGKKGKEKEEKSVSETESDGTTDWAPSSGEEESEE